MKNINLKEINSENINLDKSILIIPISRLHSGEQSLNRKRVNEYKNLGIEKILTISQNKPILYTLVRTESSSLYDLDDRCHRVRALYELGQTIVLGKLYRIDTLSNYNKNGLKLFKTIPYIPVLTQRDYKKWYEKNHDEPFISENLRV